MNDEADALTRERHSWGGNYCLNCGERLADGEVDVCARCEEEIRGVAHEGAVR